MPTNNVKNKFESDILKATFLLMPTKGRRETAAPSLKPKPAIVMGVRAIIIMMGIKIKKYIAPTVTPKALETTKKEIAESIWMGIENNMLFKKTSGFFLKK
jgi:hypothetical protein